MGNVNLEERVTKTAKCNSNLWAERMVCVVESVGNLNCSRGLLQLRSLIQISVLRECYLR